MLRTSLFFILFSITQLAHSQREVQYIEYLPNPMAINPAQAGAREVFHLNAIFRRQIVAGYQSLATSQTFAMDGALGMNAENKGDRIGFVGLGIQGILDRTGAINNTAVFANIAYHYKLSDTQRLSVGLLGGINVLPFIDGTSQQTTSRARGSVGAGVHFDTEQYWVGVSMPEILKQNYNATTGTTYGVFNYGRPIFFNIGLKLEPIEELTIKPSLLITYISSSPIGFDINVQGQYMEKMGAGLSYRKSTGTFLSSVGYIQAMISYNISKNILVGYAYSSKVAENPQNGRGIHELYFTFIPNPKQ